MGDANPTLLSVTRDRAWIDALTARILIGAARDAEALPVLERARKGRETLVKADTSVIRDQTQLIGIHFEIARIHARAGRVSESRASYESAVAVSTSLADAHPDDLAIQSQLAEACKDVAEYLCATGKPAEALPLSDKAMAIHRKMLETDPSQQHYLADGVKRHGIVLQKCGRTTQAVSAFREAITLLEGLASPTPGNIYDLACSQSLLSGVAADAGSGLTAADGQAEADKAMKSLRRAIAAGWHRPGPHASRPDLDPIRSRPDFQMLDAGPGHARRAVRPP